MKSGIISRFLVIASRFTAKQSPHMNADVAQTAVSLTAISTGSAFLCALCVSAINVSTQRRGERRETQSYLRILYCFSSPHSLYFSS